VVPPLDEPVTISKKKLLPWLDITPSNHDNYPLVFLKLAVLELFNTSIINQMAAVGSIQAWKNDCAIGAGDRVRGIFSVEDFPWDLEVSIDETEALTHV
jgi:hypothetical protein